jgi:hypothetical protein
MPRSIIQIDRDLDVERAIWVLERRSGNDTNATRASRAKLDRLLDERLTSLTPAPGAPATP